MAGHSDQREQNYEAKYLHKVLSQVDEQIPVPDSVRGIALRSKLDNVYPTKAAAPNKKSGLNLNWSWLSWRSGFSYAAAFAIIVTLFYGLGFNQPSPSIVDGQFAAQDKAEIALAEENEMVVDSSTSEDTAPEVAFDSQGATAPKAEIFGLQSDDEGVSPRAFSETPVTVNESAPSRAYGVGGGSVTLAADSFEGYTYTWRTNDPTDPDKGQYPITVDIVEDATNRLEAQIDLPDMHTVTAYYYEAGRLSMLGEREDGIVTRLYDVKNATRPTELLVTVNPGSYVDSRLYKGILHTVTYSLGPDQTTLENTQALPDSALDGICTITAVDVAQGIWKQKSFTGAGEDITLHNVNAYIGYTGKPEVTEDTDSTMEVQEGSEPEVHFAQIRLEGLDITLGGVS